EASGTLLPGESVERDAGGLITRVITVNLNRGAQTARGVDFGLLYQKQTPWGTFTSLTQVTYLYEFLFPQFAEAFVPGTYFHGNLAGITTDPGASNEGWYRWKGDTRLDWTWKGFDLNLTCRYTAGFREREPGLQLEQHWVKSTFI